MVVLPPCDSPPACAESTRPCSAYAGQPRAIGLLACRAHEARCSFNRTERGKAHRHNRSSPGEYGPATQRVRASSC